MKIFFTLILFVFFICFFSIITKGTLSTRIYNLWNVATAPVVTTTTQ